MSEAPSLRVPLSELGELPDLAEEEGGPGLAPVPAPDVPSDRALVRAEDLAGLARSGRAGSVVHASGALGAAPALVVAELARQGGGLIVAVAAEAEAAAHLASDVSFLLGSEAGVLAFPAQEALPWAEVAPDRRAAEARLSALFQLGQGGVRVLCVPAAALARKVVPRRAVLEAATLLREGGEIERDVLAARLADAGYVKSPLVDDPGGFAVRGALVDVWPPTSPAPVRVELYGSLVMSLKRFDPDDQRTGEAVPELWLPPVREALGARSAGPRVREAIRHLCDAVDWPSAKARALADDVAMDRAFFGADGFLPAFLELEPLAEHLPADATFVLVEPQACVRAIAGELGRAIEAEAAEAGEPHFPLASFYVDEVAVAALLSGARVLALHALAVSGEDEGPLARFEACPEDAPTLGGAPQDELARAIAQSRGEQGRTRALDPLLRRLLGWQEAGWRTLLTARARTQAERLVTLLRHRGARVRAVLEPRPGLELAGEGTRPGEAVVVVGSLSQGLVSPVEMLALVTEEDVFGARAERRAARAAKKEGKKAQAFLEDLRTLAVGDWVVHVEHGVGRYLGLVHRDVGGATVDFVALEYAGGDKLYVPVYRLSQVQKYSGGEGTPKIDRLGGQTFAKTKARAREDVRQMADGLLRLYAERRAAVGEATPGPDDEYQAFEATFPFDETPDQARAIAEVATDLEAGRPMDRLVCGDVGFGKTEVAIRAAYRVAASGRQVAVLCPTTVLAQQHYLSFAGRFAQTPLTVRPMSRFQTKKEQDDTLRGLKQGTVDVVVGTHRLLSKDVHFQRLGLLVVDEEQRFGVAHKERIKALKANVDVLTLSATPIPRTLQMAVTGLRDMSIITTPPADRRAIRTVVTKHDDAVVREAVQRELGRGGQVFYVYNRVEGLYEKAARLQALVPAARIAVAHGQMNEAALEKTMIDFVEGRFDVLCATAIIESGLDIPRANTMIIDRADLFGLAQLYQLRGRVGRSKERAYCYLVVPPPNEMSDEARARIEALERFTELGSGFQIASLDLELRGAGDLLGAEQHGAVASVGLEMFCQMLEEAVSELRGEVVVHDVDPELTVDVPAVLPEGYVSEVGVRLSLYKRLASASSDAEVSELAEEMEDRFGPPPEPALRFVELMRLKTELRALRAFGCEATKKSVTLHLREDAPLDHAALLRLVQPRASVWRLSPDGRLTRRSREAEVFRDGLEAAGKALAELAVCRKPG